MAALPLALLLIQPFSVRADDSDALLDRARNEYPPAVERLEAAYARVRGSGHSQTAVPLPPSGEQTIVSDFSFAFDGDRKRAVRHLVDTSPQRKGSEEVAFCFNKRYRFRLSRKSSDKPYLLNGFATNTASPPPEMNESIMDIVGSYLSAACNLYGVPMSRILASPRFRFIEAAAAPEEGDGWLRLKFESREPDRGPETVPWVYRGSIVVDPANSWRVQKAECFFSQIPTRGCSASRSITRRRSTGSRSPAR